MSKSDSIQILIKKLSDLGYQSYQIKNIISECTDLQDLNNLTAQQENEVLVNLQEYIAFAVKCRSIKLR